MNGLLAVVLEDHIREHMVDAHGPDEHEGSATEQLIDVVLLFQVIGVEHEQFHE